jgi:hypothetical protein
MSVSPTSSIGASLVAASNKVASGATAAQTSGVSAALAEANESKATTIQEAQSGDRIAQKKLQALQAKQQAAQAKAAEPGKGGRVDHDA